MENLSKEEAALFFSLWFPLLDYANEKDPMIPNFKETLQSGNANLLQLKKLADRVWDDLSLIDEYLAGRDDLTPEQRELILSWKRVKRGNFVLERHLKKGSVFISMENSEVYLVKGLFSTWEELFRYEKPPVFLNAALLPFRDCVISDGLVIPLDLYAGKGARLDLKEIYMDAKRGKRIHTTL